MNRLNKAVEFYKERKSIKTATKSLIRIDELTKEELDELIDIYDTYEVSKAYEVGDLFKYKSNLYKVIQKHASQEDWKPNEVASLYKDYMSEDVIDNWKQPQGAHDAYNKDDKVIYNDKIYISTTNNNVWKPTEYGWKLDE